VNELKPNVPVIRPVIGVREPQDPLNPDVLAEVMSMGFPILKRRDVGHMSEILLGYQPALEKALRQKSIQTLQSSTVQPPSQAHSPQAYNPQNNAPSK
jgi:hypothetical protein